MSSHSLKLRNVCSFVDFQQTILIITLFFLARVKGKNDQFEVNAEPTLGSL